MKRLPLLIPCLALATLLATQLAFAQEGMKMLKPAAFTNPQRPPAVFKHDEHNQKAKLDDCVRCHHGVENGKRSTSVSSEGTPCADCHKVKPTDGTTSLTKAYILSVSAGTRSSRRGLWRAASATFAPVRRPRLNGVPPTPGCRRVARAWRRPHTP